VAYWLNQLREVLRDYYPPDGPADVVGYLKGSGDPNDWRMKALQQKNQFMILGSIPPTKEEWAAAGKSSQDPIQTIHPKDLDGLIILYGGFMIRTPWGRIHLIDAETLKYYQSSTIDNFRSKRPGR